MSVLLDITLMQSLEFAFLVVLDVINAHLPPAVKVVLLLFSFKESPVRLAAIMASLLLEMFAKVVPQDALSVLRISSVTIVLITSICTRVTATLYALLELLELIKEEIGSVPLVMLLAKLA